MDQLTSKTPKPDQESKTQTEYVGPNYWKESKRSWTKYLWIIIVLIILGGLYWVWQHPKTSKSSNTAQPAKTQASTSQSSIVTNNYSSNFALNFDYPKGWFVTDSGNGVLTVTSTTMQLANAAGQNVNGQVVMTIANKGQNLSVFDKGNAVAVLDSQKISYTKPTPSQRANTYLSFLQYASTTQSGALDGVYVTGDFGYQKGQDVPKTDIANIDPLVSVTFKQCATLDCPAGTTKALSISSSSWSNSTFSAPILKMLRSLSFS